MPWLEIGVVLVIASLVALVIRYARSDAKGEQRAEDSEETAKAALAFADRGIKARSKAELKARSAARRKRRRKR